ncbi:hypothetical protein : Serine/threonine protein kinase OS=Singulisphaera acidiphila (strain ATCC BAA-1392 / DSM 18658 / VKM B-2454 / MOB10) GN=Sinac_0241 PE=4 SV=1: PSCyt1 [Gemmataceae bacterium]|nr:hypothetical protein : Serine/threonine protein kinase OS=Singulisphaera acidiphila (strain ATCC BAA-1392 / DSM 18658 / VKM B-2454 / MOB10) GN=Sinac_0241 PE=4 SV=1: PSCyt1 [Gemmataceae bacterium]VTT99943.1 hypothetical protein : Serine/threonine protein kinase OS=Singulisphaera acidiphila (strain ATCC BAA-1392 / DSM 18658 / VKM B-2454 / MOB10) GN=Sinac_0241 PE=4 SV=1: PSCyt1 [Gemmataceae bacterium]
MSRLPRVLLLVGCVSAASVGAQDQNAPKLTHRQRGDLALRARAIFQQHCFACHGGGKSRSTLRVLQHDHLVAKTNPVPFVVPGNPAGSQVVQFLEDGSMPPGTGPRPTPEEVAAIRQWVAAGAPRFPVTFDDAGTLQAIAEAAAARPADAPHLRYLSFSHLVTPETPRPDLAAAERSLQRALSGAGVGGDALPEPVDDAATLFRLDARKVRWDDREVFSSFDKLTTGGVFPLSAYDLLLLEYPHLPAAPVPAALGGYLAGAKLARDVPFLRADWLADALYAREQPRPLAGDLKSLAELSAALAKPGRAPAGPAYRPFDELKQPPAVTRPAAQAAALPFASWYSGDAAVEPPPLAVTWEFVGEDGGPLKAIPYGAPFKLRLTGRNNLRFRLLLVGTDGVVRVQATNRNGIFNGEQVDVTPAQGATFRITPVRKGANEYFVLFVSESPLPPVTIVRSRHGTSLEAEEDGRYPVTRFLFNTAAKVDDGFDPAKWNPAGVVRKVIPIPLTATRAD